LDKFFDQVGPLESSGIYNYLPFVKNPLFDLSLKEASYLIALLEANRQTALQLLAADHFYEPSLLPRLKKFQQTLKTMQLMKEERQAID
jgi:choline kinase